MSFLTFSLLLAFAAKLQFLPQRPLPRSINAEQAHGSHSESHRFIAQLALSGVHGRIIDLVGDGHMWVIGEGKVVAQWPLGQGIVKRRAFFTSFSFTFRKTTGGDRPERTRAL